MARTVSEQYMNELHEQFHSFATWEPGTPLKIGDIGELNHNEFTYVSSLKKKGIPYDIREDATKIELKYSSANSVSVSTKLSGMAGIPQYNLDIADAGIIVEFASDNGIAFEASGVKHELIEDVDSLDDVILKKHQSQEWKDNWVVISDLMTADSATILISNGKDAKIALRAKADVPNLSLANVDAGFETTYTNKMNTTIVCQSGLTPLFKLRGIVKKWWPLGSDTSGGIRMDRRPGFSAPARPSSGKKSVAKKMGEIRFTPFK